LTGEEHKLTLKMSSIEDGRQLSKEACQSIIERWWSSRIVNISLLKGMSDGSGAVFDI
jgi:hypothetical protein